MSSALCPLTEVSNYTQTLFRFTEAAAQQRVEPGARRGGAARGSLGSQRTLALARVNTWALDGMGLLRTFIHLATPDVAIEIGHGQFTFRCQAGNSWDSV